MIKFLTSILFATRLQNPLAALAGIFATLKHIRSLVAEQGYDIVHVSTPMAAFMVRLALRRERSRTKVIYTAHGFHFFKETAPLATCSSGVWSAWPQAGQMH